MVRILNLGDIENNPFYQQNASKFMQLKALIEEHHRAYFKILNSSTCPFGLLEWITDNTPLLDDPEYRISTKCFWIMHGLTEFPQCKQCRRKLDKSVNRRLAFINVFASYPDFCSVSCSMTSEQTSSKIANTKMKNHGDPNWNNRPKARQTMLDEYGVEYYCNPEQRMKTKQDKYGDPFYNNITKIMETKSAWTDEFIHDIVERQQQSTYDHYGVRVISQHPEFKKKIVNSIHQTSLETYGVDWPTKSPDVKQKMIDVCQREHGVDFYFQTDEFKEKSKASCLLEYGVEYYVQSDEYKHLYDDEEFVSSKQEKMIKTKKQNGTLNTSKPEQHCLKALQAKFGIEDIETQYKSHLYPWHCDFYIKSIDFYIELNAHWTHGGHFFNQNDASDLGQAEKLKQLGETTQKKSYQIAYYVWTQLDPKKAATATANHLHYLVFWSEKEMVDWIDSVKLENLQTSSK